MDLSNRIDLTRSLCESALISSPLAEADAFLAQAGVTPSLRGRWLRAGAEHKRPTPELVSVCRAAISQGKLASGSVDLERALLVRAALSALDEIPGLAVDESVKHLFCKEFEFYAKPADDALGNFDLNGRLFSAMSEIVSLTRFPAGQYQWVVSGFPRSWFVRVPPSRMAGLCWFLAKRMGGLFPYFVPHVSATTHRAAFLTERGYYKAFYRMASALEMQPDIKGIMAVSWMHSRETHRISPHLGFYNRPYTEAGGVCVELWPAGPKDGFLKGDPARTALYNSGQYKPTHALVLCTREQALRWKGNHSEIEGLLNIR